MNEKNQLMVPSLLLAIAFVIGLSVFGHYYYLRSQRNSITVTGSASQQITSDVVVWNTSISETVQPSSLKDGNTKIIDDTTLVTKYFETNGIADNEIIIAPLTVRANYKTVTQQDMGNSQQSEMLDSYTLTEQFTVNSHNVDTVTKVAKNSSSLLSQGIILSNSDVEYLYSKLTDLKKQMLSQATTDAQARAQSIAKNAGSTLGGLQSASMGVMQITAPNSTDLSGEGSYDTSSIQKEITAIVHASFLVK